MKKSALTIALSLALAPAMLGQGAMDMLQVTQPGFRGTARFMGMGGAFTALGGDLSTLTQNPAGIGIYRHSEIGATLDISIQKQTADGINGRASNTKVPVACNNFGYIGAAKLDGVMKYFQWGASYNRLSQFDRLTNAYAPVANSSLTNYIAGYTSGRGIGPDQQFINGQWVDGGLNFSKDYNPYRDSDIDWLSILAFNSFMINEAPGSTDNYQGLRNPKTINDASLDVRERGYVDEYNINFGGNFSDIVYWGLGVGITDLSYKRETDYSESLENATIYSRAQQGTVTNGNAGYVLSNYKHIDGSGWKLSFGLIFKPVNEFRIGVAVHTPTWWSLTTNGQGSVPYYSYLDPNVAQQSGVNPVANTEVEVTDWADYSWRLKGPWRFMVGAAGVIGGKAIISLDYERVAYNDMTLKYANYDNWGYISGYSDDPDVNADIKRYTRAANIIRVGAEYRVTPQFSVRAGYNLQTSNIKNEVADHPVNNEIVTSGTDPSYSFDKSIHNISFGLGYRWGAWSVDGTYVHTARKSTLHAYTCFNNQEAPQFDVTGSDNSIVLSLAFHF